MLLLSELADHTRNLRVDPRLSLLLADVADPEDGPLAAARLTLIGTASVSDDPADRERFVRLNPQSETFAAFSDFAVWRVRWERAHLIAGFGHIAWLSPDELQTGQPAGSRRRD